MSTKPKLTVQSDYDDYFGSWVKEWIDGKESDFKHTEIVVSAGPYRMYAVTYESRDGVLSLDFYSALRNGFGELGSDEISQIKELL